MEKRTCLTLMLEKANILQAAKGGGNGFMFPFQETVSLLGSVVDNVYIIIKLVDFQFSEST